MEMREIGPTTISNIGFGEYLLENGVITTDEHYRVLQGLEETQMPFHLVADTLGVISESQALEWLSKYTALETAKPAHYSQDEEPTSSVSRKFLKKNGFIITSTSQDTATCILYDPFNTKALSALSFHLGKDLHILLASSSAIDDYFETDKSVIAEDLSQTLSIDDITALRHLATEQPVIKFVNKVIEFAVDQKASDIHLEPTSKGFETRLRIDGILIPYKDGLGLNRAAVISRIKILAKMDIAERRLPQDSRIRLTIKGRPIDLRVSTVPTLHGENLVLRILNRSVVPLDFSKLGYDGATLESLNSMLKKPNGLILVTGPTGSGKTTTLYTALKAINDGTKKIFTVEDPVEYQLQGISQIATQPSIGLDFAKALRSILRQDPDVIMVGEIRDHETAEIAIQASLTGHLVIATLHTNSAAASITRLLDMGVQDYLLSTSVVGIVAQRLVRQLCNHCSEKETPAAQKMLLSLYPALKNSKVSPNVRRAVGCLKCNGSGFFGRSTIYEIATMSRAMQRAIADTPTESVLNDIAINSGMNPMRHMGLQKVWTGETTLDEVLRVTAS